MVDQLAVTPRSGAGLAIIQARRGIDVPTMGARLGMALPTTPRRTGDTSLSLIGTGAGTWFAVAENASDDWAERLTRQLTGLATVFDQSSGYSLVRIAGHNARRLLQAGVSIDLDPSRFTAGQAASTMIGHINVLLWQVDDQPAFDLASYRSYATSLHHWIDTTATAL